VKVELINTRTTFLGCGTFSIVIDPCSSCLNLGGGEGRGKEKMDRKRSDKRLEYKMWRGIKRKRV
jgi:hypothetical protein